MAVASPQILIADLRRWLARMESHGRASAAVLPFDIAEVDAHVPGGLQLGHLHEVIEGGAASEYTGLATPERCSSPMSKTAWFRRSDATTSS
jgi:protein ImuA